ncbi:MAG: hypothetical protein H6R18_1070 [Proteobacteria bacterium]|nr:hypothetical protein [Pseudomonadota bacterium]
MNKIISVLLGAAMSLAFSFSVQAREVNVVAALAAPVIQAGATQKTFLKVSLTGFAMPSTAQRSPLNVAIVIDRSGSMSGERIEQARNAAVLAVESLNKDDIVSVVAYDTTVEVVSPAARAANKDAIIEAIRSIRSTGTTALFAGVSKGAQEVRKHLSRNTVNRVILLSDGKANVGPSSPYELGELGASLGREGISVTTIGLGLGYNEDLMTQLAGFSDGNHAFVANAQDLARIFKLEFGDASAIVAQDVDLVIHLAKGIRPLRMLGREGEIVGQNVRVRMNQLGSEQEKFVMLEVEVPAGKSGDKMAVADVDVSYLNMASRNKDAAKRKVELSYTDSAEKVAVAMDKKVMKSAVEQVSNVMSKQALKLRDEGKTDEAKKVLNENAAYVQDQAVKLDAPELKKLEEETRQNAASIGSGDWNAKRKSMKEQQYRKDTQQKY